MITAKNYAAQAEKYLRSVTSKKPLENRLIPQYLLSKSIAEQIKKSIKFAIPDNGIIFNDGLKGLDELFIKLPFDNIALEFYSQDSNKESGTDKFLILCERKSDKIIVCGMACVTGVIDMWGICPISIEITEGIKFDRKQMIFAYKNIESLFADGSYIDINNEVSDNEMGNRMLRPFFEFIEALSCTNVEAAIHQAASPKNAQRIKSNKLPIYETKVLTIKAGSHTKAEGIRTGTHASPRQHLRRGHIRRLESGNIWVNSCVVGAKENGIINKSYRITA